MWTSEAVLKKAAEWIWIPYDAVKVETPELTIVVTPQGKGTVLRFDDGDVDEAARLAREAGANVLVYSVHDHTRPVDVTQRLLDRGALIEEELDVCALPLDGVLPGLAPATDITVVRVDDPDLLPEVYQVNSTVFGSPYPTAEFEATDRKRVLEELDIRRFLAYADGKPVGSAGLTQEGPVSKLWGGGVLEEFRGRGIYRALLWARLAEGVARGSELALVKARVGTSSPILKRAGFTVFGTERQFALSLS